MPHLTLTFDNGPDPETTGAVLRVLAERDLRATFFVVGDQLRRPGHRDLAERALEDGHWIGNHSLTHAIPLGEDPEPGRVDSEIGDAQRLLGELAHPDKLFRPFGGGGHLGPHLLSRAALGYLLDHGYSVVLWNSVPRDWEDPAGWATRARDDIAGRDWTVLVLHDLPTGAMEHLPGFLDQAAADGVEIVQELPRECVPIRRGVLERSVDRLVSGGAPPAGR